MKTAIIQCADTGPLESIVVMLRHAGYECSTPSKVLKHHLRDDLKLDTVLDIEGLVNGWGYDYPMPLPEAGLGDLASCDLYVDVKGHRNGPRLWERYPRLKDRTLWYRINGGAPEHVIRRDASGNVTEDCGDEVNPPCPVLTPNQWYAEVDRSYCCWPPFVRFAAYNRGRYTLTRGEWDYGPPLCLIHNLQGWGYGALVEPLRAEGVRMYGAGSPDGLIRHPEVRGLLRDTLAYVHLKSSDAPGYALYEALASGCPVVCTRRLIWRCRMQDLLIPGETCLVFDRETHDPLGADDVLACTAEVRMHLENLRDYDYNRQIGEAGQARLADVQWREGRDGSDFRAWMGRMFP